MNEHGTISQLRFQADVLVTTFTSVRAKDFKRKPVEFVPRLLVALAYTIARVFYEVGSILFGVVRRQVRRNH